MSFNFANKEISTSLRLLGSRDRRRYKFLAIIQSTLALLDLAGVALFGVIGALAARGIRSQPYNKKIQEILEIVGLDSLTFQQQVAVLTLLASTLLVGKSLLSIYISRKILNFLSTRSAFIANDLVMRLFNKPLMFLNHKNSQEVQHAIGNGVNSLTIGLLGTWSAIISDSVLLSILILGITLIDPTTAFAIGFLFLSVSLIVYRTIHVAAKSYGAKLTRDSMEIDKSLMEMMLSYRELLVRNRRYYYAKKVTERRFSYSEIYAKMIFVPNVGKYIMEISLTLGGVVMGALQFYFHDASHALAGMAIFLGAGSRLAPALLRLQQNYAQLQNYVGMSQPTLLLVEDLKETSPLIEYLSPEIPESFVGKVVINGVSFKYHNSNENVLTNINLEINPGDFVAIVGPSGSGKSTLVDLILGVNKPDLGTVLISSKSPEEAIRIWPEKISYVPQTSSIIDGTFLENICLGYEKGHYSEEEITDALNKSRLRDFVNELPLGLETKTGEFGSRISGGQRQRLGIARAFISSPNLLILDEATSALDARVEQQIIDELLLLRGSTTLIVIAHRLSTILNANKIVYVDKKSIQVFNSFEHAKDSITDFKTQAEIMGL